MPLPFTITFVPPGRSDLRRLAHSRATWVVAIALLLGSVAIATVVHHATLSSEQAMPSGSIRLIGVPADITVTVDGRPLPDRRPVLTVPAGEHTIAFHGERVVDSSDRVVVRTDETTTVAPDLWLRQPMIRELRPTYPGSRLVGASFLSDGRVALVEAMPPGDADQLWLVAASGEVQRVGPSDQPGALVISPDGGKIAYVIQDRASLAKPKEPDTVWVARFDGGSARLAFALPSAASGERLMDLSWAPDGQDLLLVSRVPDQSGGTWSRLRWLELAHGTARELVTFPGEVAFDSYTWDPAGDRVAFVSRLGQSLSLCTLDIASASFQDIAALGRDPDGLLPFAPAAWSADGRRLLYTAGDASPSSRGLLFWSRPRVGLFAVNPPRSDSQPLGTNLGQYPALLPGGAVVLIDHPGSDATYVVRRRDPTGQVHDLFSITAVRSSSYAVLWDLAHDQAILATINSGSIGQPQATYWLVRFGLEASR